MYFHWRNRNAKQFHNSFLQNVLKKLDKEDLAPLYEKALMNAPERSALEKEMELIALFGRRDLGTGTLVNLTAGGEQGATSWSPQTRKLKSEAERAKQKGHPVCQYTSEGEFLAEFTSAKVASESVTEANRSYITQCCKGKRVSSGGFLWAYKGEEPKPYTKKYYRQVEQRSLDGELLNTFTSLTEAQKETGVELHNISECCRGKSKTAGRFVWSYVAD